MPIYLGFSKLVNNVISSAIYVKQADIICQYDLFKPFDENTNWQVAGP